MKIAFIGTVEFSYNALKLLIEEGHKVVVVLTKAASDFNADFKDLTPLCAANNIPYKIINDANHINNVNYLASFNPDVIYCFGWSGLLKTDILNLCSKGVVGFHPAKLPHNRGRHPIIWALALGLNETASTFFMMDEGADTGDIVSQVKITIDYEDDAKTLYDKITIVALEQIKEFSQQLFKNKMLCKKQNKASGNTWRKRGKKDGEIDFKMDRNTIYNIVRALTYPYIGAHYTGSNGDEIKIWKVSEVATPHIDNFEYGKVLEVNSDDFIVKCAGGAIKILKHEFPSLPQKGTYL